MHVPLSAFKVMGYLPASPPCLWHKAGHVSHFHPLPRGPGEGGSRISLLGPDVGHPNPGRTGASSALPQKDTGTSCGVHGILRLMSQGQTQEM